MSTIRVQPAARRRKEFALWAIAQSPKVRTVAPNTFAVPGDLFTDIPEEVLIGALVDGHRFVSPSEDAVTGTPAPAAEEWAPPVLPEREAVPGEPLPELPETAYGPDAVALPPPDFAPLEDAPADGEGDEEGSDSSDSADEDGAQPCSDCGRPFSTPRGLATHRRQKHAEGA
jgi:hypothetical protein